MSLTRNSLDHFNDIDFWKALNPALHVLDESFVRSVKAFQADAPSPQTLTQRIITEGYFQFHVAPELWQIPLAAMASAVKNMAESGIMPVFAFMYDEFWLMYMKQRHILAHLLGSDYIMLPDFWVWHIDPLKAEGGFPPHRDRCNEVFPKDRPNSLTVWIPLSNATPDNSCIYIIPTNRDPTYNTTNDSTWDIKFQDIRALPAKPGDVLCWTTSVLHWGSHSNPLSTKPEPRISVGVEFQRADVPIYRQPPLNPLILPAFKDRLTLIATQLFTYKGARGSISPELEELVNNLMGRS